MSKRVKRYARRLNESRLYAPLGLRKGNLETVTIDLDEFEALRLVDLEGLSQIEASDEMQVSRATLQRLLLKGRKKTVDAILSNKIMEIKNEITNIKLKGENKMDIESKQTKFIAIPTSDQVTIDAHFGKTKSFALYRIENNQKVETSFITPPPHTPGAIPLFLKDNNVDVIITGNMGQKAIKLFEHNHIDVILGAQGNIKDILNEYLDGFLVSKGGGCNHNHDHNHDQHEGHNCKNH